MEEINLFRTDVLIAIVLASVVYFGMGTGVAYYIGSKWKISTWDLYGPLLVYLLLVFVIVWPIVVISYLTKEIIRHSLEDVL